MDITVEQIVAYLSEEQATAIILSDRGARIRGVRLFDEMTYVESGFIYLGYSEKLRGADFANRSVCLACLGPVSKRLFESGCENANVIELMADASLESTFNKLQVLFEPDSSIGSATTRGTIFNMFAGKGLQNILDVGHGILANPLYLLHGDYILVANSTKLAIPDAICEELHQTGRLDMDKADEYFGYHSIELMRTYRKPEYVVSEKLPYNRIINVVQLDDGDYVAVAVVEYERGFQASDYDFIESLCTAVKREIDSFGRRAGINEAKKGTLVNDLLNGTIADENHLALRLSAVEWSPPAAFSLLLLRPTVISDTYLTFFRDLFTQQFPSASTFIYRDSIIVFAEPGPSAAQQQAFIERLGSLCEMSNLHCAVSEELHSILDARKAFKRAFRVLQTASRLKMQGHVFQCADFSLLFLIETLSANAPLAEFVHPAVMDIREYDREHEGDYLLTLRTYLANGKDLLATFEELHIHRNTLSYRLRRLAELFNIDWNDGRLLTQLYLSLEMLRFIEP